MLSEGDRFYVEGDSKDLWITDYNVRVSTGGTLFDTMQGRKKKVLVRLDTIDGDEKVVTYIRKDKLIPERND